jgi:tRNA threonylcarbamoyladenosine biosynthesis protein TsaB
MIVLGIDTALSACSAAIMDGQATMSHESLAMNAGHAEALAPMVKRCFVSAQILPTTVERIGVTIGPGTFTGLRVGLALARGMAVALECPVVGVTTFEALAYQARAEHRGAQVFVVALDARRGEVYLQAFDPTLDPLIPPSLVPLAEAVRALHEWAGTHHGPVALSGSGSPLVREQWRQSPTRLIETKLVSADARFVARWAAETHDPAEHPPSPLYLRGPDAKPPGERKRRPSPRLRARRGGP